jgi:hypothetical protein
MRLFGHPVMVGVLVHIGGESAPSVCRVYQNHEGQTVLHWHDVDGECWESPMSSASQAIQRAEKMGMTHVLVGKSHDITDVVPIHEAALLVMLDGGISMENSLVPKQSGVRMPVH